MEKWYKLKSILFNTENSQISKELGKLIFISKGKRKIILPTEFDLWTEAKLFENGIVLKKNKKEKIDLKSCDMNDLDVFIDELCKLFSQKTEKVVIKEAG